jgi:uncharacterized membrane protein
MPTRPTPSTGTPPRADSDRARADRLTRSLGWASLLLGLPEVARPGAVDRLVGVGDGVKQQAVTAAAGARELMHAASLLHPRASGRWVWGRLAGDAIDLAALGRALRRSGNGGITRTAAATAAVAGITALDLYAAVRQLRGGRTIEVHGTTTIGKSPHEVYEFWRRLENLPSFMAHVVDVRAEGERSHWTVRAPLGQTVEWTATLVTDRPGEVIAWRTEPDADIRNEGRVRFVRAPKDLGTEVHVELRYEQPGGSAGQLLARVAGEDPRQQLDDDLRRLKQVLETGEVVRSDGAPRGKRARHEFPQRPAQPMSSEELAELDATTDVEVHA